MTLALGLWIFISFGGWVFLARWVADVRDELASVKRDELASVKHRVGTHHEALGLQLEYNRLVARALAEIANAPRSDSAK